MIQFRNDDERAAWTAFAANAQCGPTDSAIFGDQLLSERRKREAITLPEVLAAITPEPPASDEAAKLADRCETFAARKGDVIERTLADAAAMIRRLSARQPSDDNAEIEKLRRELAAVTKAANLYQERADISDEYRSWLTRIGKAIGCGHLDERLPMCVIQELEKARQPSAIERFSKLPHKRWHDVEAENGKYTAGYGDNSGSVVRAYGDTPEAACAAVLQKLEAGKCERCGGEGCFKDGRECAQCKGSGKR